MCDPLLVRWDSEIGAPPIRADQVIATFLRHCRAHASELREVYQSALDRAAISRIEESTNFDVGNLFDGDDLRDLRAHILDALESVPSHPIKAGVIVARGVANALDLQLGPRLSSLYRQGVRTLKCGDPFIVTRPRLKDIFGKELGTLSERFGDLLDECYHVRILGESRHGLEAELDMTHADALATLGLDGGLGVAWVNERTDLDWTANAEQKTFRLVRPRSPEDAVQNAREQLEAARKAECAVVVLPELSLDPAGVEALVAWSLGHDHPFRLLVLGSAHQLIDSVHVNRSTTVLGTRQHHHDKWNPLNFDDLREEVHGPPRVRLVIAGDWSFVVLICKDFLDHGVLELLIDLQARLVLVPTRSEKTEPFAAQAAALASRAQAIVLVANASDGEDGALVGRPLRRDAVERVSGSSPGFRRFAVHNQ